MDVLMGSLDIRELLSSQDVEDSTPLSAPDLRLLIDRLHSRSLDIKHRVRSYIHSHHREFSLLFSRCSLSLSLSQSLSSDLSALLSLLPPDSDVRPLLSDLRRTRRLLSDTRDALDLLLLISNLISRLHSVADATAAGSLPPAAEAVRDLKDAVPPAEAGVKEPAVYGFLRQEWTRCFNQLQEVLARTIENAILFDEDDRRVRVRYQLTVGETKGVELSMVLQAMDIVGVLDYGLAKVADLMIKHVIIPAVCDPSVAILVETNQDSEQKYGAILSLVSSSELELEHLNGATIFSRLISILKFIYEFIFFGNGTWMRCFGRLTWPRISELVITDFLSKVVPNDSSKILDFQNNVKLATEFEIALKEIMYISPGDIKDDKLSSFAQNVEVHFASRKRSEILAKVRHLLLHSEFVLTVEDLKKGHTTYSKTIDEESRDYAVDLLFQPEKCLVSEAASKLMELVHQTLQGMCSSSSRVAMEFYHAVRDALLLYEAVVPMKLEKQLNSVSQVAVVIHNDCFYFSQEISGFAFEYRSDFPNGMKERTVFVDLASSFRQMAEEILQKQIQLVNVSLKEALDGADGFQNTHQMLQFESAKFSIDQVIFILEKVHILWEPLLLPSTYRRSMCVILDFVFSRITEEILLLDDLAAEETLQLQRLIHIVLENLSSVFESLVTDAVEKDQLSKGSIWFHVEKLIPSLSKLCKLADLLDMPLKFITTTWESGELTDCGFTSSEVQNIIKAIFQESPLRKDCLLRMGSTNSL